MTAVASAVGVGISAPVIQANTTALNVIVSQPTGTIAVGETINYPVRIENPGTDAAVLGTVTSSLGDPVNCPADPNIAAGGALLCSTDHVVTAADITAGTLDIVVDAQATVSACNVDPLTPVLTDTVGVPFTFTDIQENGAVVTGYQFNGQLLDANGTEAGQFHIRVESNGSPTSPGATQSGNDITWRADILSDPNPPVQVRYVIDTVANGFISAGKVTTTGMAPVDNGAVNGATGFDINLLDQATGAILLAEDQPDEVINADAGDTLNVGTVYDLTDTNVTGAEAPQYVVEYSFADIADGDQAEFWFNQYGGAIRYEQHVLSLNLAGCSTTPVDVYGTGSQSIGTWEPAITLAKSDPTGTLAVDETVTYTFDVTNTGNVELASIALDDPLTADETCPATTLAAGASMTCSASYVVTQADVDAGTVDNTATVTGYLPDDNTSVTDTASVSAPITANPALTLTKTASPAGATLGDTINYSFVVTNTGNVTLTGTTIDDPLTTDETCPADPIAPGDSITCTATYVITVADADAGTVSNTATVAALDPNDTAVNSTDTNTYTVAQNGALSVTKSASPVGGSLGDTIGYTFVVTNTGDVTLTGATIDDPLTTDEACSADPIAPGGSITCTATYVITQADADAGTVSNTATVTALDPNDGSVNGTGSNTYTVGQTAALSVTKTGVVPDTDGDGVPRAGDPVDYTITVTNTGSVTIDNIVVSDAIGTPTCDATSIASGGVVTCTIGRALTQTDIDSGAAPNTATATGTDPGGATVTASGTADTAVTQSAELTVNKSSTTQTLVLGDTINYTVLVYNTGNVTADSLAISDPLTTDESCPVTTIAPGGQVVCTASYVVTQADVDAGTISNTATVTATGADGASLSVSSTVITPGAQNPSMTMTKSGVTNDTDADGIVEAGETIDYTFVVTNTGNVQVTGLTITDPSTTAPICGLTELVPGQMTVCTASHTLTQTEINAGAFSNEATADALDASSNPVSTSASTVTSIQQNAALGAAKSGVAVDANDNGQIDAGETIDYTIAVTNTGNVTIDTITVDDPLTGTPSCDVTTIDPGATATCSASYTLAQADIDFGSVTNDATVAGLDPFDGAASASATTTDTVAPAATMSVAKTGTVRDGDLDGKIEAGEFIDYTIEVTNTGNVTITGVAVSDPTAGTPTCDVTTIAPGATATCTVTLTITQAQLDVGGVSNTATAGGLDPQNNAVQAEGTVTTPLTPAAGMAVGKTGTWVDANDNGMAEVGEAIDFTITVLNTGNVTLDNVVVTDPTAGDPTCDVTTIAPNVVATCTVSYTLTQTDVDAGTVGNTATASAIDPNENAVGGEATASVPVSPVPELDVTKVGTWVDGDDDGMVDAGESIDYTITVTNSGNVTLSNVAVSDPLVGDPTCDVTTLAPAASATCTVSYAVTETDIAAGSFDNSASATAIDPNETPVSASGQTSTALLAEPLLEVSKSGTIIDVNGDGVTAAGDKIMYTVLVKNVGNVTISNITVEDPLTDPPACDTDVLAPGASTDCAVLHTLTQGDIDGGIVLNTATVNGIDPSEQPVSFDASTSNPIATVAAMEVTKSSAVDSFTVGSVVSYSIVVRNTGNVTMQGISIDDQLTADEQCPATSLAPGDQMTCTATYALTQADIDAGETTNTADIFASDPSGGEMFGSASATTPYTQSPQLSIAKTGTPNDDDSNGQIDAGDTVGYVITVTNSGNVSVTDVAVSDPMLADLTCDVTTLAPGMIATCTGTYTLTQADVDTGALTNTAAVVAKDPNLADVTREITVTTVIPREPRLVIDAVGVHGDTNDDGVFQAGETIEYTATVTNTGNVNVDSLVVNEPTLGTLSCDVTALAPGESAICTVSYPLTQADIDAGQVNVTLVADGVDPANQPVSAQDVVNTVVVAALPELTVTKTADLATPGVGDTINYTITVTNTGNVTIADIGVTDELTADESCDGTTVAPGESITCTATYLVTQADVDRGSIVNTATATGISPTGDPVDGVGAVTTPFDVQPRLTATKTATFNDENADGVPQIGETIDYTITVTNTGNVTLIDVAVDDPTAGTPTCGAAELAPEASTDCLITHTLTAADIDAGELVNTATATATAPDESTVTAEASVTTPLAETPGLSVTKTAELVDVNANGVPDVGERMVYTITIANTGNVTMADVVVVDTKVPEPGCDLAYLAAGEQVECVVNYTLTQADLDAREVTNTASAAGTSPSGAAVGDDDTVTFPLTSAPKVTLAMSGSMQSPTPGSSIVGAVVDYSFVVTNEGNVTLNEVLLFDNMNTVISCPTDRLASGDQMICTSFYVLTQDNMDAGNITNVGDVMAFGPGYAIVSDRDTVALPLLVEPKVEVTKTGEVVDTNDNMVVDVGDTIDFTIEVSNSGNVTITDLTVEDELTGPPNCDAIDLVPGAIATCTVAYSITAADVAARSVSNTVSVTGGWLDKPVTASTEVSLPHASTDSGTAAAGESVTIDVLANDSNNLLPDTLRLLDADGNPVMRLDVFGEGTWSVSDGKLIFTPEFGFSGTTTPVRYFASNADGLEVASTAVAILSPGPTTTTDPTTDTTDPTTGSTFPTGDTNFLTTTTGYVNPTYYNPPLSQPPRTGFGGGLQVLMLSGLAMLIGAGLLITARVGRRSSTRG